MKKKSMQKSVAALNSAVLCPVHQGRSSSKWATTFYDTLETLSANMQIHGVVWDWHDVPGAERHHMHIDACVFVGESCVRFEIDGEAHFMCQETCRDRRDIEKDAIFREQRVGLVHLHYRDVNLWEAFVKEALRTPRAKIQYSPSYSECLEEEEKQ
jgi:hypothetical protein